MNDVDDNNLQQPLSAQRVEEELARILLQSAPLAILGNAGIAVIVVYFLRGQIADGWLLAWLAAMALLTLIRYGSCWRLGRRAAGAKLLSWRTQHTILTGVTGMVWGAAMIWFFTPSLFHQMLLTLAIGGLTAGAAASYSSWPRAFFAFAIPGLLPLAVNFFLQMENVSTAMGLMVSLYVVMISVMEKSIHRSIRRMVVLSVERNLLVERLSSAKEAAEKMSLAKDDLLSRVSHELRTPLNAILGFAQLLNLRHGGRSDNDDARAARQILDAGEHLIALIDEILELARAGVGEIPLSIDSISARQCLDECISFSQAIAVARDIKIVNRTSDKALPYIKADETRVREVILNLLSNAIKFSDRGTRVVVDAERIGDDNLKIGVTDHGPGIPPEAIEIIFEPFGRVAGSSEHIEGSGMGLAICRRLIELMGGEIGVDSEPGSGSTFWFQLPLGTPPTEDSALETAPAPQSNPPVGARILYIEDDEENRGVMEAIFEHLASESELECAPDAEAGLERARAEPFDVILMDINLPGIDGFEAFDRLREADTTAGIPVIAISAAARPEDREKAIQKGFNEYLTKPIEVDGLFETINEAIESGSS